MWPKKSSVNSKVFVQCTVSHWGITSCTLAHYFPQDYNSSVTFRHLDGFVLQASITPVFKKKKKHHPTLPPPNPPTTHTHTHIHTHTAYTIQLKQSTNWCYQSFGIRRTVVVFTHIKAYLSGLLNYCHAWPNITECLSKTKAPTR